jgi:hypothetical protein
VIVPPTGFLRDPRETLKLGSWGVTSAQSIMGLYISTSAGRAGYTQSCPRSNEMLSACQWASVL